MTQERCEDFPCCGHYDPVTREAWCNQPLDLGPKCSSCGMYFDLEMGCDCGGDYFDEE